MPELGLPSYIQDVDWREWVQTEPCDPDLPALKASEMPWAISADVEMVPVSPSWLETFWADPACEHIFPADEAHSYQDTRYKFGRAGRLPVDHFVIPSKPIEDMVSNYEAFEFAQSYEWMDRPFDKFTGRHTLWLQGHGLAVTSKIKDIFERFVPGRISFNHVSIVDESDTVMTDDYWIATARNGVSTAPDHDRCDFRCRDRAFLAQMDEATRPYVELRNRFCYHVSAFQDGLLVYEGHSQIYGEHNGLSEPHFAVMVKDDLALALSDLVYGTGPEGLSGEELLWENKGNRTYLIRNNIVDQHGYLYCRPEKPAMNPGKFAAKYG